MESLEVVGSGIAVASIETLGAPKLDASGEMLDSGVAMKLAKLLTSGEALASDQCETSGEEVCHEPESPDMGVSSGDALATKIVASGEVLISWVAVGSIERLMSMEELMSGVADSSGDTLAATKTGAAGVELAFSDTPTSGVVVKLARPLASSEGLT